MAGSSKPQLQEGLVFRVCHGPSCNGEGEALGAQLTSYIEDHGHSDVAAQDWQSCFGRCTQGPNIMVERWRNGGLSDDAKLAVMLGGGHPDCRFEHDVKRAEIPALVERHLELYWEQR